MTTAMLNMQKLGSTEYSFEKRSAMRATSTTAVVAAVLIIACLELVRFAVGSAVYQYEAKSASISANRL